jgi:hypothetical protein
MSQSQGPATTNVQLLHLRHIENIDIKQYVIKCKHNFRTYMCFSTTFYITNNINSVVTEINCARMPCCYFVFYEKISLEILYI